MDPTKQQPKPESYYRSQSFWLDSVPGSLAPRPALETEESADVVIIGAGYTGLWTAYYLKQHAPHLTVTLLEADIAGFGASGRNGGWCTAYLSGIEAQFDDPATREAACALQRLMNATVDEVGRVSSKEAIDCHYDKSGHVAVAVNATQLARDRDHVQHMHALGFGEMDYRWLDTVELQRRLNVANALGGYFMPHCAAIHPARLARGLAKAVVAHGAKLYEQSPVLNLLADGVVTAQGKISAKAVIMATEGFTGTLAGLSRKLIPIHSLMIATEPLSDAEIAATGLQRRYTWNNGKHLVTYGQLTADGRIAFGSRGHYRYGAGIDTQFSLDDNNFNIVRDELAELFPSLKDKPITHAWGGPMGVSRTLQPAVCFDKATRFGWAGGYFGDGVGASNLAGRTLADLILGRDTERSRALWVNPPGVTGLQEKRWEPEPLRWTGINTRARMMGWADAAEARDSGLAGPMNHALETLFP